ncbi:GDT1 family protein [Plasmodiophora brassicae]|uniref:Uncharacterized protein n=1 Tax=Plasmodiophora brassicae TaxID=37360 RepID=A0A3P3YG60_PLABS|nr:unnamed protein product [Plasmodiophora brassicae]
MTLPMFWGAVLVAYSVPASLFIFLIYPRMQLFVTFVFGVAAWILAMVATSIIGCAFTSAPLILAISLVMLELFRFCLIYMYRVVQPVFARTSVNAVKFPVDDLSSSLAAGLGFATVQAVVIFGSVVDSAVGPGMFSSQSCPNLPFFVSASITTFLQEITQISLMVVAFAAVPDRMIHARLAVALLPVVILHAVSVFANELVASCTVALPLQAVVAVLGAIMAAVATRRQSSRQHLKQL